MPREAKKRGRRASQKHPRDENDNIESSSKRQRTRHSTDGEPVEEFISLDYDAQNADEDQAADNGLERRYYGMLDEQEHEYFKNADQMLEVNQFRDAEERSLFIENLHKEAAGKELKLACGQTGSRLLERLIQLSTPDQLENLFQQFKGEYIHLMSHRFASHCCETLFCTAAPIVSEQITHAPAKYKATDTTSSVENAFLDTVTELKDNFGFMMTNRFASHCLRILILILSGKPTSDTMVRSPEKTQHKSLVASKRKENVSVASSIQDSTQKQSEFAVPQSFVQALGQIFEQISSGLDTTAIRAFATHRVANPTLQLLLQQELSLLGKQRGTQDESILKKLIPDEPITENSDSAHFINAMIFDPVGSHLVETIIQNAPGKTFKALHKELFRERIPNLARHDTASYVVCALLERLSTKDLGDVTQDILPEIPTLVERGRTNVLKTLAERLTARSIDAAPFADALKAAYSDGDSQLSLAKMLQLPEELSEPPTSPKPDGQLHITTSPRQNAASILAQTLLRIPGPLSAMLYDSLTSLDFKYLRCIAHTSPLSPILQTALTAETGTTILRRKITTHFYGAFAEFSVSPSASHVVDAVEVGTRRDLAFVRERIAEELSESENVLRDSSSGRKVWRNWNMDLYKRDRDRWIKDTRKKVGNNGFQSFPGVLGEADVAASEKGKDRLGRVKAAFQEGLDAAAEAGKHAHQVVHEEVCEPIKVTGKSALDRARERYALRQQQRLTTHL